MTHFSPRVLSRLVLCYLLTVPLCFALKVNSAKNMGNADSKVAAAVATFSAKFCNELAKDESVVSSPLSAEFVLALLTLGATNDVHDELLTSLGIKDDDSIRSSFAAVSSKVKSIKGVTLNVANKVYIKDGPYELNPKLEDDAVTVFDAGIEKMDFSDGAAAADIINKWVESKTNSRIKDLLSPDALGEPTRLVLVNALYFKGTWAKQFEPRMTSPRPFYIKEDQTINVPMMFKEDDFKYGESEKLNAQLLQLNYVGGEASMLIVLPKEIDGLDGVLQKLADGHDLMSEIDRMYTTKVQVHMPKFKIETEINLTEVLPKLGISAIFDPNNTGLSKILNTGEHLYVSTAIQKAFIEVNEEGAEAAAATVMSVAFCSAILNVEPVPRFVADRPFMAAIIADGIPHFLATYRGKE